MTRKTIFITSTGEGRFVDSWDRRWEGARIGNVAQNVIPVQIQREKDRGEPIDDPMPFGLAVTIEMPGEVQVYEQAKVGIDLKPHILIQT